MSKLVLWAVGMFLYVSSAYSWEIWRRVSTDGWSPWYLLVCLLLSTAFWAVFDLTINKVRAKP